jgi:tRNA(Ile)-lysidine synthase
MNDIKEKFIQFLTQNCHCLADDYYLLAISGGIDSMVMLDLYRQHGLKAAIAHCNFQLRGPESDEDENFVRQTALKYKVPFYSERFNTLQYSTDKGISIQMAARELRYEWFNELARDKKIGVIATAHHKDDSVETFLINLSRGTGISGLTGIKPRFGNLVRPLLFASREEIRNFAISRNIVWREDSSNSSVRYIRNKIRHQLLPKWTSILPGLPDAILKTASHIQETKIIIDRIVSQFITEATRTQGVRMEIEIAKIKLLPSSGIILYEVLQPFGYNYSTVERLLETLDGQPGKRFLSRSHEMIVDRSHIIIQPLFARVEPEIEIPANTLAIQYPLNLSFQVIAQDGLFAIPPDNTIANFDLDSIHFPLLIRKWKKGDYFYPLGMKGRKKLSDFFIDSKIPIPDKKRFWVMESGGNIAWIIGLRIDDRFKIVASTGNILQIVYQGNDEE